jgi:hypothetical protein
VDTPATVFFRWQGTTPGRDGALARTQKNRTDDEDGRTEHRLLTPLRAPITITRTGGGVLSTGADGSRPGAGRSTTWRRARVPCLTCRTIRALGLDGRRVHRAAKVTDGAWISLPGGTPSGRIDPRCCLGLAGQPRLL